MYIVIDKMTGKIWSPVTHQWENYNGLAIPHGYNTPVEAMHAKKKLTEAIGDEDRFSVRFTMF